MTRPALAAIALGSNVGDRAGHLRDALARLARIAGVKLVASSHVRETAPVGGPPQGPFLNGVVLVETTRTPKELLNELLAVERALGRVRGERNGPRTIDLDLIFHGDSCVESPELTLPHPRAHLREFVLAPLAEVAPQWRHPRLHRTARELADALPREQDASSA